MVFVFVFVFESVCFFFLSLAWLVVIVSQRQVNVALVFIVSRDFFSYSSMLCDTISFFFTILAMGLVLGSDFCSVSGVCPKL